MYVSSDSQLTVIVLDSVDARLLSLQLWGGGGGGGSGGIGERGGGKVLGRKEEGKNEDKAEEDEGRRETRWKGGGGVVAGYREENEGRREGVEIKLEEGEEKKINRPTKEWGREWERCKCWHVGWERGKGEGERGREGTTGIIMRDWGMGRWWWGKSGGQEMEGERSGIWEEERLRNMIWGSEGDKESLVGGEGRRGI